MGLNVNVQGGTGGGRKRPLAGPLEEWFCRCPNPFGDVGSGAKLNPRYLVRCPDCGEGQPR